MNCAQDLSPETLALTAREGEGLSCLTLRREGHFYNQLALALPLHDGSRPPGWGWGTEQATWWCGPSASQFQLTPPTLLGAGSYNDPPSPTQGPIKMQ